MPTLLFAIGVICGLVYLYVESLVAGRMIKHIHAQEPVRLPGKKWHYLAATASLPTISSLAFYLAVSSYYRASLNMACVSMVGILGAIGWIVNAGRLKYITFDSN